MAENKKTAYHTSACHPSKAKVQNAGTSQKQHRSLALRAFQQRIRGTPKKTLQQMGLVLLVSLLLSGAVYLSNMGRTQLVNGTGLRRNSYGQAENSYDLQVHGLLSGKSLPVTVTVGAQRYTQEEADAVFQQIVADIEEKITAEDESLDAVRSDLTLPSSFPAEGVQASWRFYPEQWETMAIDTANTAEDTENIEGSNVADASENSGDAEAAATAAPMDSTTYYQKYARLIEESGKVNNESFAEDETAEGYLSLILSTYILPDSDEDSEADYLRTRYKSQPYKLYLRILPRQLSEEQRLISALTQSLTDSNEKEMNVSLLQLPAELLGHRLSYSEKADRSYLIFPFLGIAAAAAIYMQRGAKLKEERKKRETQLMLDYSELVSKLIVYLGAGFTVRNAFERILSHFDTLVENGQHENRYLYDELRILSRQLSRSIPESTAYADFARRINLKPYTKLISLIEQNRKNGSKNLRALLSLEMEDAFEQRKTTAKRLGEEAGTRLLLPLFLQLGIVMAIVVVPAMTSLS